MDQTRLDALAERMDRLERENARLAREARRARRLGAGGLLAAVVLLAAGANLADESKEIAAERFVLNDKLGKARMTISVDATAARR